MWNEGELSLEFGAEEIVELVEALFADNDKRRQAIREIRSGR
jgi:protein transport protein DSL1/ZW10